MEYEKCYVFEPEDGRSAKRRRTEPQGLQASWGLRKEAYQKQWQQHHERIEATLREVNNNTVQELETFLDAACEDGGSLAIPTALVTASPGTTHGPIFDRISASIAAQPRSVVANVPSNAATNLKSLLKTLISGAMSNSADFQDEDEDDHEESRGAARKGPRLLSYDLRTLSNFVREQKLRQVALVLPDTEAFDSDLLSDAIELLSCWRDRIPFVLVLGLATSVEFLEQRLAQSAIRCLKGNAFGAPGSKNTLQRVFHTTITRENKVWIGPELVADQLERQSDYVQSVETFASAAKYAHMAHYYANALSVFVADVPFETVSSEHYEAARNVPSFQEHAKSLLNQGHTDYVRDLLEDDKVLDKHVRRHVSAGQGFLVGLLDEIEIITHIQTLLPGSVVSTEPAMYVQAMSGKLHGSALLRNLLLSIRKSTSEVAIGLLNGVSHLKSETAKLLHETCANLSEELSELLSAEELTASQPLKSAEDVSNSTLRTTVVSQKVELSKQKSTLSKQDAAYTAILRKFTDALSEHFDQRLIDPKTLPFHEIFIYDLEWPHRGVFTPRPRNAIERALASPHDYLACQCCKPGIEAEEAGEEGSLSATQPATAVLYQLYLESGSLINVHDLWQAFSAVLGNGAADEEEAVALFQRGLAEMRYLGLMKSTRKKTGHVGKVAWRGL
ncbi:hypothetical protein MBLNU230_g4740t1 [Neophaeotheca triangularis]